MKRRAGSTLIGLLAVIAILGIGIALYLGGGVGWFSPSTTLAPMSSEGGRYQAPSTPIGSTLRQARGAECRERLSQLRQAMILRSTEEERVTQLSQLGFPSRMLACPVSHKPYFLNPETQTVSCLTEGHTAF